MQEQNIPEDAKQHLGQTGWCTAFHQFKREAAYPCRRGAQCKKMPCALLRVQHPWIVDIHAASVARVDATNAADAANAAARAAESAGATASTDADVEM